MKCTIGAPSFTTIRRSLIMGRLLGGILVFGGNACADQRADSARDSAAATRARQDPETMFRARVGQTWMLAQLGDQDIRATHTAPPPRTPGSYPGPRTRPTIRFTTEPATVLSSEPGVLQASGWSFCNGYGTAYALGPGDQLRFHGFQSTLVGCGGPDSLETRYFRALASTRRFELDSSHLSLVAVDGSRLRFEAAPDSVRAPASQAR